MSHKSNKFWLCALPVSLLILAAAYYVKVPTARRFIDAHTSLGRQLFGSFVHDTVIVETVPRQARPAAPHAAQAGSSANGMAMAAPPATPTPRPVFDLQKLAGDPSLWPKKVALKKATTFPAVVGGKVVGSLVAPAGAEANLKGIKEGKVGVEYQGGGAWLPAADTDLEARVMGP